MTRKTITVDRATFTVMLTSLDACDIDAIADRLLEWEGGETCNAIDVDVDSRCRLDGQSSPRPSDTKDNR